MYYFSAATKAFYPDSLMLDYEMAGALPDDLVEVTEDEWKTYGIGTAPEGMRLGCDDNGKPAWEQTPVPGIDDARRHKVESIKLKAHALLVDTDWYVVRMQETGEEVPDSVQSFRSDVRQAAEDAEEAVAAMNDAGEVLAYQVAWPSR